MWKDFLWTPTPDDLDLVLFDEEGKLLDIWSMIYNCPGKYWNLARNTKEWTTENILGAEDLLETMRKANTVVTRRAKTVRRSCGSEATLSGTPMGSSMSQTKSEGNF